jgi:hypothetical protein
MAIEPVLEAGYPPNEDAELENELEEIEVVDEGAEPEPEVDEEAMTAAAAAMEHDANLADHLDKDTLTKISSDLLKSIDDDKSARKDWEKTLEKGLELLGTAYEEHGELFEGASGVVHPLLSKAVVQFQAQAYGELYPAGGPAKAHIVGVANPSMVQQGERVKDFINYLVTEEMEEFEEEFDNLLFRLPIDGSAFKKTYWDDALGRPASRFVLAHDLIVPYTTNDIRTCTRFAHEVEMSINTMDMMMASGAYLDIDLGEPEEETVSELEETDLDVQGITTSNEREEYTLFEVHVTMVMEGFEEESQGVGVPYIVTIEEGSRKILAIRRNWNEGDESKKRKSYFSHYKFMPGLGFYGFGLTHMIGNLSITATALLRMLIDAGVFSNLPGGFKAKGMRIRGDNEPIKPGEFRDVDVPGGNLKEQIIPLPFKEPSSTLLQLLGMIIEAGNDFASSTNEKIADSNEQAPVGTTIALLEQGLKVMSGVHKRCHRAQKNELRNLNRIVGENYTEYPYEVSGKSRDVLAEDFNSKVDVLPVSDPNIFSMTQRVSMAQTELRMVTSDPELHGKKGKHEAYRRMYSALGVQDIEAILPPPEEPKPKDPATEASEALTGEPMYAFEGQDHATHIDVHVACMSLPTMINPVVQLSFESHILEHMALQAKEQADQEFEQRVESISKLSPEVQQGAAQSLEKEKSAFIADAVGKLIDKYAEMRKEAGAGQDEDPLVTIRKQELAIKTEELRQSAKKDADKMAFDRERGQAADVLGFKRDATAKYTSDQRTQVARERIASSDEQKEDSIESAEKIARMRPSGGGE